MSQFLDSDIYDQCNESLRQEAEDTISRIKYQIQMLNNQVAMNSGKKGYDYKTISDEIANSFYIERQRKGQLDSFSVSYTDLYWSDLSDKMKSFIQLAINNAINKTQSM